MALKFLNKKGWHTGSLRNIENVWKAEQKHENEQKKLDELRKQIQEERERSEFRLLQEQAGLVPKQERLEFLYDSGLAVGKGSSSGFKALDSSFPKTDPETASSSAKQPSVPGALFEERPQSANDAWRKLHSDPLLLIRQREQEALARVKNNPIQMAMIRKSVEAKKHEKASGGKELRKKHKHKKSKHGPDTPLKEQGEEIVDAVELGAQRDPIHKGSKYGEHLYQTALRSNDESNENDYSRSKRKAADPHRASSRLDGRMRSGYDRKEREDRTCAQASRFACSDTGSRYESGRRHRNPIKLSEEERAARLHGMQMDAELHEEQRWKRLNKAEENEAHEAHRAYTSGGSNFLDVTQRSIYGAEKGGSLTIEESVRRRTHYSQGRSEVGANNAFRR